MSFLRTRVPHVVTGLAVMSMFAVLPIAAQAAETNLEGTLSGGALSNTAPAVTPFTATLTGVTQTVKTAVGAWNVTDATGANAGYSVTVAATAPTVGGSAAAAGTGSTLTLTPATATAAAGNPAATGPVADGPQTLTTTASTIENAPAASGQGGWEFAADAGTKSLSVVIPGNASVGAYSSTLTFTTAPPAA
ncbi:MAG: WxL domain-containing protein [Solirubrobacteraceae bacterium]|jgi:hypothetical protein